jgi:hypothetical protein
MRQMRFHSAYLGDLSSGCDEKSELPAQLQAECIDLIGSSAPARCPGNKRSNFIPDGADVPAFYIRFLPPDFPFLPSESNQSKWRLLAFSSTPNFQLADSFVVGI